MLNSLDKDIIRKLQEDLPLVKEPYRKLAEDLGISEEKLMERLEDFKKQGILKRVGAVLRHRKVGYKANAMVVWDIPREKVDQAAKVMITYPMLSHCYEREKTEEWPYNMYTMIHCESTEECKEIISDIMNQIGKYDYTILYSTDELKKTSVKYFTETN